MVVATHEAQQCAVFHIALRATVVAGVLN
eukprot:SAG11_NODE_19644_length_462_cov_0.845730_2_plen_28_part_01